MYYLIIDMDLISIIKSYENIVNHINVKINFMEKIIENKNTNDKENDNDINLKYKLLIYKILYPV